MDVKEDKIRKIVSLYYSKPEVLKAIFSFSKNREVVPRYFEGFGKRPDSLQYESDIFEMAKKGATSFHCSEEIWENPLGISTGMNEKQLNQIRTGWDLLVDIDCKYFDFSKKAAQAVINVLKKHGIKNFGIKYSGSKGFHIIVPWKAFPKIINGQETKNLFPELPRKIISYVRFKSEGELNNLLTDDDLSQFEKTKIKRGIKCGNCHEIAEEYSSVIYNCENSNCRWKKEVKVRKENLKDEIKKNIRCLNDKCNSILVFDNENLIDFFECRKCDLDSKKSPKNFSRHIESDIFELMGLDLILVSPRHLFRAPYSLHEKTSFASVVISENELAGFQPKDADPIKVKIKNFLPDSKENEAEKLVRDSVDWFLDFNLAKEEKENREFKPIKLEKLSDSYLPPSIKKILLGMEDGKKRALFILINLFRSIGMEKEEMEKRIFDWNKKNPLPLKEGYLKTQIIWSYRNKIVLPPNFDKDYYRGIGIIPTEEEMRLKNPVTYVLKKAKIKGKFDKENR
ncbi:MAG: DNA primase small subunit domain-containing protein [Nanoarchaeota archaeon]